MEQQTHCWTRSPERTGVGPIRGGRCSWSGTLFFFTFPAVFVVFVLMVFPVLYTVYMSLHSWFASSVTSPEFIGLENFKRAFLEDERFRNAFLLTLYFTILATAIQLVLGVALALLLNRPFRGKGFFRSIFLLPMVATPVAIALVWMMMYNPTLGVMNYLVGLMGLGPFKWVSDVRLVIPALAFVDTWEWTPLITLITLAGLASLPLEPYESALIDGATPAQMFWRITLPLLRPTIMVALLFRSIDCLKTFDIIYVMTAGGPGFASETLNVYTFQVGLFYFHIGYASSLLVILFALVMGVSLVLIKVRRGPGKARRLVGARLSVVGFSLSVRAFRLRRTISHPRWEELLCVWRRSGESPWTYLLLVLILLPFLFPLAWMLLSSLKTQVQNTAYPPVWVFTPTLNNYREVFIKNPFFTFT